MKLQDFISGQPFTLRSTSVSKFRFSQCINSETGVAGRIESNPYTQLYTDGWKSEGMVYLDDFTDTEFTVCNAFMGTMQRVTLKIADLVLYTIPASDNEPDDDAETFGDVDNTGDYFADQM